MMKIWVVTLYLLGLLPFLSARAISRKEIGKIIDLLYDYDATAPGESDSDCDEDQSMSQVGNTDIAEDFEKKTYDSDINRINDVINVASDESPLDSHQRDLVQPWNDVETYIQRIYDDINKEAIIDRLAREYVYDNGEAFGTQRKDDSNLSF